MANLHDKSKRSRVAVDGAALQTAVDTFLTSCRSPAVFDDGDGPHPLQTGFFSLETVAAGLMLEAWSEPRSISRRIIGIERHSPGILDCVVQRFGGAKGTLTFVDLDRPQAAHRTNRAGRQSFAALFRRMLSRQFPSWEIQAFSSAPDLRRSFPAAFPRASLLRGQAAIAALACSKAEDEGEFLTAALLWHDHRAHCTPDIPAPSLCLFLPERSGIWTAHRLRWLTGNMLRARLFLFNEHGMAGEVDAADLGNIETTIRSHANPIDLRSAQPLLNRLKAIGGIGFCPELNGALSIRMRGLEFARIENGRLALGIENKTYIGFDEFAKVQRFAYEMSALAYPPAPLPERWLESSIRANLPKIDPALHTAPVHGQVLTFAGGNREVLDLLAISCAGRLTILELKASEDLHLPVQALDYWIRIRWHAQAGELDSLFPGLTVSRGLPKLLLIAPALSFHPANEIVLRYFSPEIEVERVGVNSDWATELRVSFRLRGADKPISHRNWRE